MPREWDDLVAELELQPGVRDPEALATWILQRRKSGNPSAGEWKPAGEGCHACNEGRTGFELAPGLPHPDLRLEEGWFAWTLRNEGDPVATWQLPTNRVEVAMEIADAYIDAWAGR